MIVGQSVYIFVNRSGLTPAHCVGENFPFLPDEKKFDRLSIGVSKEAVIEKLGQPEISSKSIESDYAILYYIWGNAIGLREGKVEWTFKDDRFYETILQQLIKFEEDKKTLEESE